ncbi:Ulvan-active sulfatase [Paenibacillus allorhizosphaerae]|uniref:Ulvan-active sulfatase n=1 Tax=Paenibacillus allorhizosphaerae TaxID=2849866 RepID=A0ABM8V9S3_9BACL|nr:Ulvan-active sulfatase [Paenibacillus allorhizosphaerae]
MGNLVKTEKQGSTDHRRPNIVFLVADDHRYDGIRAFGNRAIQTPVLDRLAESGVSFTRVHIMGGLVGAVCVPSRAALHTGVNVFRASVSQTVDDPNGIRTINPEIAVLPQVLQEAGYHTYATGKWHNDICTFAKSFSSGARLFFGGMSDHRNVPLHHFDPSGQYPKEEQYIGDGFSTELFADAAVDFLQSYRNEAQPYFLYVAFTSPHDPRTPPKEYADLYDPEAIDLPDNYLSEHPFDNGELQNRDERLAQWPRTPEVVRRHIADYYGMISHMDAQIGRIIEALN